MSDIIAPGKKASKKKNSKFAHLIGPTDPAIDTKARNLLLGARVNLLVNNPFFGHLATRLRLVNADEWCSTAATDGRYFYYNSRFIMLLRQKEVVFLFGHEVLHIVYDHIGRIGNRNAQIFNIANDYAVNADLKRHRIGEFITSVPCLYEAKYDGKISEVIYDDLMKNAKTVNLEDLINQMIDEHLDSVPGESEEGDNKGPKKMTDAEREELRREIKQSIISAAKSTKASDLPNSIKRLLDDYLDPIIPWRDLIQTNLTSAIKNDYSFARPSRRGWHLDAILPSMTPGEEIDVTIALDMSGSITDVQAKTFISEVVGMMDTFDGYKIHIFCFDTSIHATADFNSRDMESIDEYQPIGGGGTDFECIFKYLKDRAEPVDRLIVFTDGYPNGSWGDENFTDVTWIIHGTREIVPPWGSYSYFD